MSFTNYGENKLTDYLRGQTTTFPTNWFFALGSAADDATFTELAGTGYARVGVTRSLANFAGTQSAGSTTASTGTSHASSNNAAISWGNPGGAWGTANYVGVFDASTSGNCWFWFSLTPVVITTGSPNPTQIAIAGLNFTLGLTGGMSDYLSNKLVDLIFRAQSYSWPATLYVGLYTVAPTNAGGGTECSVGSYARVSIAPSLTSLCGTQASGSTAASSGTGGRTSNNAAITFPAPTADWGTVVAMGVFDAATTGNLLFWHTLTASRTVNNGGPAPSFAADALGITLD